ncbi:hypothetical protein ZIOFF_041052 [Zingiber officinale]|uniref:Uncharacterized protein n=1 Tax=Zingiber officinale TaxID=94328 RepID=A0A8J5G615_ZINOF|nr:hypothetical protein ZIOFF_041052 [Zingiber officinale]
MEPKTQLHKDLEGTPVDATEYRRIVGYLRYLLHTRPDLSYSVGMASRYMQRLTIMHHKVVKQILSTNHSRSSVVSTLPTSAEPLLSRVFVEPPSLPDSDAAARDSAGDSRANAAEDPTLASAPTPAMPSLCPSSPPPALLLASSRCV